MKAPKYASFDVERFFAGTPDVEDVVLQLSVEMINNKEMKMKSYFLIAIIFRYIFKDASKITEIL
ncbi:MAG: hypothetical protein IPL23_21725 [Saprospiraceae bacterium]|nr:hypothetical protein [Saprospiraceae bacterium]